MSSVAQTLNPGNPLFTVAPSMPGNIPQAMRRQTGVLLLFSVTVSMQMYINRLWTDIDVYHINQYCVAKGC